jgi:hypothetical protein
MEDMAALSGKVAIVYGFCPNKEPGKWFPEAL